MADCLFCSIAAGEIDSEIIYEDEQIVAFRDINPQAPVHFLVIPRRHISNMNEVDESDTELVGHIFNVAGDLAEQEEIAEDGYRLVINNGDDACQDVNHLHLHVLGGRGMGWPPG